VYWSRAAPEAWASVSKVHSTLLAYGQAGSNFGLFAWFWSFLTMGNCEGPATHQTGPLCNLSAYSSRTLAEEESWHDGGN
jgi:hypothetical protein